MAKTINQVLGKKFSVWNQRLPIAIEKGYRQSSLGLINRVKGGYLSGQVLGVITGNLRDSIKTLINKGAGKVVMKVGTGVDYGAIWFRRGRDFLNPAIQDELQNIEKKILDNIMDAYPKGAIK